MLTVVINKPRICLLDNFSSKSSHPIIVTVNHVPAFQNAFAITNLFP